VLLLVRWIARTLTTTKNTMMLMQHIDFCDFTISTFKQCQKDLLLSFSSTAYYLHTILIVLWAPREIATTLFSYLAWHERKCSLIPLDGDSLDHSTHTEIAESRNWEAKSELGKDCIRTRW
jgi:uncharacterized membrane protein YhdT